jgi:hypothetical protein
MLNATGRHNDGGNLFLRERSERATQERIIGKLSGDVG